MARSPIVIDNMTRSLARLVALLVAVVVVLSACRVQAEVQVYVDDDQSGTVVVTVELDGEAVDRLEGVDALRTDDLVDAGWEVDEPRELDDGSVLLRAEKAFADPGELQAVLGEVSGPDGPYGRLGLRIDRPFARTQYRLEGVLDGSGGVDGFADPGLAAALDGLPFGTDLSELEAELGAPLGSLVQLRLAVALPGDQQGNLPPNGSVTYTQAGGQSRSLLVWETDLEATGPVPVLATSETMRTQTVVLAGASALLVVVFLLLIVARVVVGLRRRRRRRRADREAAAAPRPITWRPKVDEEEPDPADEGLAETDAAVVGGAADGHEAPPRPALELVVIGGPGAMFGVRDVVDDVVAFARAHGSMMEYPRIAERYQRAAVGRLSTAELWVAVGAEGDPQQLDEEFLGQYALVPGLREFVARARDRSFKVAYMGDGPAAWAEQLRRSFVLGVLVETWIVSGSVGVTTPEPAIFEALRRTTGVEPAATLIIDDRLRVLEAAGAMGYGTAWFSPSGRAVEAPGHSIIRGFSDLLSG